MSEIRASPVLRWGSVLLFVVAIGLVVYLAIRKSGHVSGERTRLRGESDAGLLVKTIHVRESPPIDRIRLIGDVRPYAQVTLYAKVSGYMKTIFVDKGDTVKQGQLLAIIESPETDKAYNAALATAVNTRRIATRYRFLERTGLVSHQEAQQAYTNADVAKANLQTEATLRGYEKVVAPFPGTITNRFVDPGQMIQNGASSSAALPLVSIAELDRVRVYCYINQTEAPFVHPGDPVLMTVRERPRMRFRAAITRIAGDLDPQTRMMLAEVDFENTQRLIVPGSFSEVWIQLAMPPLMIIPAESLVTQNNRTFAVIVSNEQRAVFTPIEVAENNGLELKVAAGLKQGEEVVMNPPEELIAGMKLRPRAVDQPASTAGGGKIQRAGKSGEPRKP